MNTWNKAVKNHQVIYVSQKLNRFLNRKSVNRKSVIEGWLKVIDLRVKGTILANINHKAETIVVQPIQLAGKIVAAASCTRREELPVLEYNIFIAYEGEQGMKHPSFWAEIYLEE